MNALRITLMQFIGQLTCLFHEFFSNIKCHIQNAHTALSNTKQALLKKLKSIKAGTNHLIRSIIKPAIPYLFHALLSGSILLVSLIGLTGMVKYIPPIEKPAPQQHYSFFKSEAYAKSEQPHKDGVSTLKPASGDSAQGLKPNSEEDNLYEIEKNNLSVEGVLVPQKTTVLSSSRDGKISKIYFEDGEVFNKGDLLIEYDCDDLKAELSAINAQNTASIEKGDRGEKLFKLEIISDVERLDLQSEAAKAKAQKRILETRMQNCEIRAAYDGRVVNRLANDHEYTRTDRVLMEIGSLENLEVEFLLPSRWLRWINIGAPLTLNLYETGREYTAHISRIHGEVDPVSQSIQITAALSPYPDPLLPGMSGEVFIDVEKIRDEGITGYLER